MGFICLMLSLYVWKWTENRINFYLNQISAGLERIAQVKTKLNNVTRNHSGQLLWQGVDSGEAIFIGNSIQTEKNSSTEIIFDDGEQILIGPESLVRFIREENKISLQLVEGKIEIKASDVEIQKIMRLLPEKPQRLFVSTPTGRLEIKNSILRIRAEKNKNENFKVEVVNGAPELITATTKEILKISPATEKIEVLKNESPPTINIPTDDSLLETIKPEEPAKESTVALGNLEKTEIQLPPPSRQPAQAPLKAPKVKSITVEAVE